LRVATDAGDRGRETGQKLNVLFSHSLCDILDVMAVFQKTEVYPVANLLSECNLCLPDLYAVVPAIAVGNVQELGQFRVMFEHQIDTGYVKPFLTGRHNSQRDRKQHYLCTYPWVKENY